MAKEIISFPNRERLWFGQNKKELADIIKKEFEKYNTRTEVLDDDGIAPGSRRFFKYILKQALTKETQPDFDIEKLYEETKDGLKEIFYEINKQHKAGRDFEGMVDNVQAASPKDEKKITKKDSRGAFIINSQPENDR